MIRTMGVALRSLDRGPIAHPRPDRIYPSFADFQSVSGSKISNLYSRELFAFTEISQGAKRGMKTAAVQLTAHGWSRGKVGEVFGCDKMTVRSYVKGYRDGGLEALKRFAGGGRTRALDAHCDSLMKEFDQHPPRDVGEAQHRIKELTGLQRSPSQIREFFKRSGFKYRKVAPIPAKADPKVQEKFLDEQRDPLLKEAQAGKRHVFFVDAAHFVFAAFLGYFWCRIRRFLPTPSGRQRFNVLGALHAYSREVVTITNTDNIHSGSVVK